MSLSNGSLAIAIKPIAKWSFHTAVMLIFLILQTDFVSKMSIFVEELLLYFISGP
jgi:hypothetical protein